MLTKSQDRCEASARELSRIKKRMNPDSFVLRLAHISVPLLRSGYGVLFVERANELVLYGRRKLLCKIRAVKARLNRRFSAKH